MTVSNEFIRPARAHHDLDTQGARPLVLAVDDDALTLKLVTLALSRDFDVLQASNAKEAMNWLDLSVAPGARRSRISVVLLDVLMPGMDGWKLCRLIKRQFGIPVVMVTALSGLADIQEARNCGADDYLIKPVLPDVVRGRVQRWATPRR